MPGGGCLVQCLQLGGDLCRLLRAVRTLQADAQAGEVAAFVFKHGPDHQAAAAGVRQCMTEQAGEGQRKQGRVTEQRLRYVAVDQRYQFELSGVGRRGNQRQAVLDQVAQVERQALRLPVAAFGSDHLQCLVELGQQVFRRPLQGVQVIALLGAQPCSLQQLAKAENAVQRGAHLVAQVAEELASGPIGLAGFLAQQVQFDALDLEQLPLLSRFFEQVAGFPLPGAVPLLQLRQLADLSCQPGQVPPGRSAGVGWRTLQQPVNLCLQGMQLLLQGAPAAVGEKQSEGQGQHNQQGRGRRLLHRPRQVLRGCQAGQCAEQQDAGQQCNQEHPAPETELLEHGYLRPLVRPAV